DADAVFRRFDRCALPFECLHVALTRVSCNASNSRVKKTATARWPFCLQFLVNVRQPCHAVNDHGELAQSNGWSSRTRHETTSHDVDFTPVQSACSRLCQRADKRGW